MSDANEAASAPPTPITAPPPEDSQDDAKAQEETAAAKRERLYQEMLATPVEGCFPKESFRPGQREALSQIDQHFLSGKRYVILEGPTGSGKSAIAKALAEKYGAYMLTSQKTLQEQYATDFPDIAVVKGRSSYPCDLEPGGWADTAVCVQKKRKTMDPCVLAKDGTYLNEKAAETRNLGCAYARALGEGRRAKITLFNYHAFWAHKRTGLWTPRELMILDEGHNLESLAMDMVQLTLKATDVPLENHDSIQSLMAKLNTKSGAYFGELKRKWGDAKTKMATALPGKEKSKALREMVRLENLMRSIMLAFKRYSESRVMGYEGPRFDEQWVMHSEALPGTMAPQSISLKPIFAGDFVPGLFLGMGARVLFMSATILDKEIYCQSIGINPDEAAFVTMPCMFPVENRLNHVIPCGNLSYKTYREGIRGVIGGIRQVLRKHQGQRGIIHSHSWKILKDIKAAIPDRRLIFQEPKTRHSREDCIDALIQSKDGVLVAPAMHEGLDLKGDLSRFQVIVKVPWPSFADPQIKARVRIDDEWYIWQTCLKLVQSSGRSIRATDDFAATYLLDSGFLKFMDRAKIRRGGYATSLLPTWFLQALRVYDRIELQAFLDGKEVVCSK